MDEGQPPTLTVIATWCNHPELIELHKDIWCRAFPYEGVEYIAYIDGDENEQHPTHSERYKLWTRCERAGIKYVLVPESLHQNRRRLFPHTKVPKSKVASYRDAAVCQYAWMRHAQPADRRTHRLIYTHSDIFPFRVQTWEQWMGGAGSLLSYLPQKRVSKDESHVLRYAWNGLCGFDLRKWTPNMCKAMNFETGYFLGVPCVAPAAAAAAPPAPSQLIYGDTGAGSYMIVKAIPSEYARQWKQHSSQKWTRSTPGLPPFPEWLQRFLALDPRGTGSSEADPCYGELLDDWCYHLRGGSNYEGAEGAMLQLRFALIQAFLYEASRSSTQSMLMPNLKRAEESLVDGNDS